MKTTITIGHFLCLLWLALASAAFIALVLTDDSQMQEAFTVREP